MKFDRIKWIGKAIRRVSYRYPARNAAKQKARLRRGVYLCNQCGGEFGPKEIHMDHVEPVASLEDGFVDWNNFIDRMFPEEHGWQILCVPCHKDKTLKENEIRRENLKKKNS